MFWIVLAAQLSTPTLVGAREPDVRAVFSVDDMPEYFQRNGVSKVVNSRTTVRPDGTTESCMAEANSGDKILDALTCAIILKRAKFRPATWMDGSPVYGVLRLPIAWLIGDSIPPEEEFLSLTVPDIELSVKSLPSGAHSILGLILEVAADPDGHPVRCVEYPDLRPTSKHYPDLVAIACQRAMADLIVVPPVDPKGNRVRSVQTVTAHFKMDRR